MKSYRFSTASAFALAIGAMLVITATATAQVQQSIPAASLGKIEMMDDAKGQSALQLAARYCEKNGGEVEVRIPYYNTNASLPDWLRLSGASSSCKFTSEVDGVTTSIWVLLTTLYTEQASLAALAYYAKAPYDEKNQGVPQVCRFNAVAVQEFSCYCSQLGGSDEFGGLGGSGGWVHWAGSTNRVVQMCTFPDMSAIDSLALYAHSVGEIRGKDLAEVLRYPSPY
jgi:putative hemolysin